MRIAVCPGSFDPVTKGHIDIIRRAGMLFDHVIVLVSVNPDKQATFSVDERIDFIKRCTSGIHNITVDYNEGLLADYISKSKASVIVKGLRAMSDFESEFQMAITNKKLNSNAETVFLPAMEENMYLSSSQVRQIGRLGGDIRLFVPAEIEEEIQIKLQKGGAGK